MTGNVADVLIAPHDAKPDFRLINLPEVADLPAVRWKLVNLGKHDTLGQVAISSPESRFALNSPELTVRRGDCSRNPAVSLASSNCLTNCAARSSSIRNRIESNPCA